jgi:hypothetical protein
LRAATAAGVALCCASLYAAPALAHLGGFISLPDFDAPVGLVVTSEPSVALEWRDVNLDPTGVFHFTYQQDGLPATPTPDPALRDGVEFGSVAVTDLANAMDWDLSAVPSGAWHIVAEAVDPPLCPAFRVAPTVVVVRREGEPMPLGALFYAPFRKQLVTEDVASLDLRAVSETAPTVTIEYGVLDPILVDVGPPEPCTEQPCPISCPTVDRAFVSRGVLVTDAPLSADPDAGAARWAAPLRLGRRAGPRGQLRAARGPPHGRGPDADRLLGQRRDRARPRARRRRYARGRRAAPRHRDQRVAVERFGDHGPGGHRPRAAGRGVRGVGPRPPRRRVAGVAAPAVARRR